MTDNFKLSLPEIVDQLETMKQTQSEFTQNTESMYRFFYWLLKELLKLKNDHQIWTGNVYIGVNADRLVWKDRYEREWSLLSFTDFMNVYSNLLDLEDKILSSARDIFTRITNERELLLRVLKASEVFGELRVAIQTGQLEKTFTINNLNDIKLLF